MPTPFDVRLAQNQSRQLIWVLHPDPPWWWIWLPTGTREVINTYLFLQWLTRAPIQPPPSTPNPSTLRVHVQPPLSLSGGICKTLCCLGFYTTAHPYFRVPWSAEPSLFFQLVSLRVLSAASPKWAGLPRVAWVMLTQWSFWTRVTKKISFGFSTSTPCQWHFSAPGGIRKCKSFG